jgi:hypothetical protein
MPDQVRHDKFGTFAYPTKSFNEVSYKPGPLAASVQSDRKRNSGSYLSVLFVGQGASEASSLTNTFIWHHLRIVR